MNEKFICDYCGKAVSANETVEVEEWGEKKHACHDCYEENYHACDLCGKKVFYEEMEDVGTNAEEFWVCQECFEKFIPCFGSDEQFYLNT